MKFWHVWKCFLISKMSCANRFMECITEKELHFNSSFCVYRNISSENLTICARVSEWHFLSSLSLNDFLMFWLPVSLEASLQTLCWCLGLQSMWQWKVKFGHLVTMLLAIIALNVLHKSSICMSDSLVWSWFNSGNKINSRYFKQKGNIEKQRALIKLLAAEVDFHWICKFKDTPQ